MALMIWTIVFVFVILFAFVALRMSWYDGGLRPPRPAGLKERQAYSGRVPAVNDIIYATACAGRGISGCSRAAKGGGG